jgi:signal transduction histidine kinase
MILGTWEIILVTTITILGGVVGSLVYLKNPKNRVNQYFTLLTLSLLIWIDSAFFSEIPKDLRLSLFLSRLTYLGVFLFATFLLIFSFHFPKEKTFIKGVKKNLFYGAIVVFSILSSFTDLVIKDVIPRPWGFDLLFGKFYNFYLLFCITFAFISLKNFFQSFRTSSGIEKLQLQYLFLGLAIFIGVSIIVNVIVRSIVGSDIYYRIGNYSSIFLILLLAIAITRYHLFGIQVILTEILVGLIGLLLIVQIFTAQTVLWKFINSLLFLLFCIFGYLLIRGVLKEIKLREEVERISQAKSEFISIASHQLRTSLTAMKGYLSMMLEGDYGELPEKAKEKIESVYQSNERLIRLVNDILCVSKIEAGEIEINLERADLREIIREVIDELSIKANEKNLYLNFEEPKELPKILLDREKIRQVILNLVDNAIKYTQKGGVTVRLQIANGRLQIVVSDTGEGLTKEEKEKLFEKFSRGTAGTKFWTEGAGLGLYIAKSFAEMHKGRIWVESEGREKGSTFYVELPMR